MSDIFLSYKSEDRLRAKIIADALKQHGYSVWLDRKIPPGKTFPQVIKEKSKESKCVIVLWSKKSVLADWVIEEADYGKKRGILIPVFIEDVEIPIGFGLIQVANLIDWQGALADPEFVLLLDSVAEFVGRPLAPKIEITKSSKPVPTPTVSKTPSASEWFDKGFALGEQGRYQEAIEACDKALKIDPQYKLALDNKKNALKKLH